MAEKKTTTKEEVKKADSKLIISPRITEKASMQSVQNAFTFVVKKNADKKGLMEEIKKEHKVTPISINIINLPRVSTFIRGKKGYKSGIKKAVVFLKKGDTIKLS